MEFSKLNILIGAIIAIAIVGAIIVSYAVTTREKKSSLGEVFTYNLDEFLKTDPALIKYRETSIIETGFQDVFAIAIDFQDQVYVAGDSAIRIFDDRGKTLQEVKLADAPRCLAVADDGTIYTGMGDHIEVYDADGVRKARWESAGSDAILTSVAVYEDQAFGKGLSETGKTGASAPVNVFVANAGRRVVLRYDRAGNLINRIGEKDEDRNVPGLVVPSPYLDLAMAPDGLLRVTNPGVGQIEAYTYDGYREQSWGEQSSEIHGFSGCHNPVNFAILADGRFVTCEKGIPRVKIYSSGGTFESVVAGPELFPVTEEDFISEEVEKLKVGLDVAVDSRGRVFVLDPVKKAVRIFVEIGG